MKTLRSIGPALGCGLALTLLASPCAAQWSRDTLALARYDHVAAESGGKVYFGGGFGEGQKPTDSVEIFDPATGTWSTITLSVQRWLLAVAATDGVVAFAGGFETGSGGASDRVDLYDTKSDTWSMTFLPQATFAFAGVGVNGRLIFHGGLIEGGGALTVAQVYDLATDTWSTVDLQEGDRPWGAAVTDGRRAFLVAGGCTCNPGGSETVDIYDSLTDQWSKTTMPRRRSSPRVTVHNGFLYVSGGCPTLRALDVYDIEAGTWEALLLPGGGRCEHAAMAIGPYVIFAGGLDYFFNLLPSADILNTVTGEWFTTPISTHGSGVAGASSPDHNTAILAGGRLSFLVDSYTDVVDIFRYEESIGTNYCGPANFNSSGKSATLSAFGVDVAVDRFLTLLASDLPQSQFGYFLASRTQAFVPFAPGSQGNLCLGGNIARLRKKILSSGSQGSFGLTPNLTALPTSPPSSVIAGDTWNFQAWFRDDNPNPASNFTDGLSVTFR